MPIALCCFLSLTAGDPEAPWGTVTPGWSGQNEMNLGQKEMSERNGLGFQHSHDRAVKKANKDALSVFRLMPFYISLRCPIQNSLAVSHPWVT